LKKDGEPWHAKGAGRGSRPGRCRCGRTPRSCAPWPAFGLAATYPPRDPIRSARPLRRGGTTADQPGGTQPIAARSAVVIDCTMCRLSRPPSGPVSCRNPEDDSGLRRDHSGQSNGDRLHGTPCLRFAGMQPISGMQPNDRFGIVRSATVWLDWHWGTNCPLCPCATTIEFVTTKRPQLNHDFPGVRDEG
jgi:hypothetical protein